MLRVAKIKRMLNKYQNSYAIQQCAPALQLHSLWGTPMGNPCCSCSYSRGLQLHSLWGTPAAAVVIATALQLHSLWRTHAAAVG